MHNIIYFRIKETSHINACFAVDNYLNGEIRQFETEREMTFEELGGEKKHLKMLRENIPFDGVNFDSYVFNALENYGWYKIYEELIKLKFEKTANAWMIYRKRYDEEEIEDLFYCHYSVLGAINQKEELKLFPEFSVGDVRWDFSNFSTEDINKQFKEISGKNNFNCWNDSYGDEECLFGWEKGLIDNDYLISDSKDDSAELYLVIVDIKS